MSYNCPLGNTIHSDLDNSCHDVSLTASSQRLAGRISITPLLYRPSSEPKYRRISSRSTNQEIRTRMILTKYAVQYRVFANMRIAYGFLATALPNRMNAVEAIHGCERTGPNNVMAQSDYDSIQSSIYDRYNTYRILC